MERECVDNVSSMNKNQAGWKMMSGCFKLKTTRGRFTMIANLRVCRRREFIQWDLSCQRTAAVAPWLPQYSASLNNLTGKTNPPYDQHHNASHQQPHNNKTPREFLLHVITKGDDHSEKKEVCVCVCNQKLRSPSSRSPKACSQLPRCAMQVGIQCWQVFSISRQRIWVSMKKKEEEEKVGKSARE